VYTCSPRPQKLKPYGLAGAPHVGGAGFGGGGAGGAGCCASVVGWAGVDAGGAALDWAVLGLGTSDGLGVGLGRAAGAEVAFLLGGFVVWWAAALSRWVGGGFGRTSPMTVRPPRHEHRVHTIPTVTTRAINGARRLRVAATPVGEGVGGCVALLVTDRVSRPARTRSTGRTVCPNRKGPMCVAKWRRSVDYLGCLDATPPTIPR
jgi:hypothetical protein